ncbi:MAG: hypothetical protein ACFB03_01265 [Paracoccaceae bacterium]
MFRLVQFSALLSFLRVGFTLKGAGETNVGFVRVDRAPAWQIGLAMRV